MNQQTSYPCPLIPGFNPDPSIVKVGTNYYLITSTFEYIPGLPIYHSTDFIHWEQIANVIPRASQLNISDTAPGTGVWAPTIRHHDGVFYVIVTIFGNGCQLFTSSDPRGPWSEGQVIQGIHGIDPDLAWDEDGNTLVTFGGWMISGPDAGGPHQGIVQARVDLQQCVVLEEPRLLWSGSPGMDYEEAPHLYKRGKFWYLLIAEGGTSRGHCVSIARSTSAEGPFEACPGNPILSARSTARQIQGTGHGDLVEMPDGSTAMVLLGVRPYGSVPLVPLGRETFVTGVRWEDDWPVVAPVELNAHSSVPNRYSTTFDGQLDQGWLAVRRDAKEFTTVAGQLVITADGSSLRDRQPTFVARRQTDLAAVITTVVDGSQGVGGLALRYGENHFFSIDVTATAEGNRVICRAVLSEIEQVWEAALLPGRVTLILSSTTPLGTGPEAKGPKSHLSLSAVAGGIETILATVDGRYFTADVADTFFTGRVVGLYAVSGTVMFTRFDYASIDA